LGAPCFGNDATKLLGLSIIYSILPPVGLRLS